MNLLFSWLFSLLPFLPGSLFCQALSGAALLPQTGQKTDNGALTAVLIVAGILILAVILLTALSPKKKKDDKTSSDDSKQD